MKVRCADPFRDCRFPMRISSLTHHRPLPTPTRPTIPPKPPTLPCPQRLPESSRSAKSQPPSERVSRAWTPSRRKRSLLWVRRSLSLLLLRQCGPRSQLLSAKLRRAHPTVRPMVTPTVPRQLLAHPPQCLAWLLQALRRPLRVARCSCPAVKANKFPCPSP